MRAVAIKILNRDIALMLNLILLRVFLQISCEAPYGF